MNLSEWSAYNLVLAVFVMLLLALITTAALTHWAAKLHTMITNRKPNRVKRNNRT